MFESTCINDDIQFWHIILNDFRSPPCPTPILWSKNLYFLLKSDIPQRFQPFSQQFWPALLAVSTALRAPHAVPAPRGWDLWVFKPSTKREFLVQKKRWKWLIPKPCCCSCEFWLERERNQISSYWPQLPIANLATSKFLWDSKFTTRSLQINPQKDRM